MKILDPACGSKMFWFNKHEPHTTYLDVRRGVWEAKDRKYIRQIKICPDYLSDFTKLPFRNYQFNLIIFDPPHLIHAGENSWLAKKYGRLDKETYQAQLHAGFEELWRVLALDGVLLFKWNNNQVPFKDVLSCFDHEPILGDQRGKTRWFVFVKPNEKETPVPSVLSVDEMKNKGIDFKQYYSAN